MKPLSELQEMNRNTLLGLLMFFTALLPGEITGQYVIKSLPRVMIGAHFHTMFPQSPVDRFLDEADYGYLLEMQYRLQYNKPFLAGVYFDESTLSKYVLKYTSGDTDIREKANTRRLEMGITAGFYPEINWLLQPYLQGRFGLAIFQSSSVLRDQDTQENIERISELTKSTPAYGLDLGIHIVPNIWYVRGDIRIGIVANPSVTFLALDEANQGTTGFPIDYFQQHTSSGRWLKVSVGVSLLL